MSEGLVLSERFRLVSQLGAGGMGSVWIAQDLNLNTEVAIKLIDPSLVESAEAVSRFRQEAHAAAMIRSTHVVQILDHGIDQGRPYMAMELLTGENLGQRLERLGRLGARETTQILSHVARAVSLAHARGIVHRDLKPENVFLIQEGDEEIAKVLDFGIARRTGVLSDSALSKTRTGTMLGTPYYMSPEQATGQAVDHLTDIWSFGVIAFECLTGSRAFDGESIGALFHAICMLPIPVPSEVAAVPQGFDAWFERAVARDKHRRFDSIKEAADALRQVEGMRFGELPSLDQSGARIAMGSYENLSTTAVSAVTTGLDQTAAPSSNTLAGQMRKRPWLAAAAGIFGVVAAVAAVVVISRGRAATPIRGSGVSSSVLSTPADHARKDPNVAPPVEVGQGPTIEVVTPGSVASTSLDKGSSDLAVGGQPSTVLARPLGSGTALLPTNSTNVAAGSVRKPTSANVAAGSVRSSAAVKAPEPSQPSRSSKKTLIRRDDNAAGI